MKESHVINNQTRGNEVPLAATLIYSCLWKAGLHRYLTVTISLTKALIYVESDDTGHKTVKIYKNEAENLKKAWSRKRGIVRNFKKRESLWEKPSLVTESTPTRQY